MRWWLSRRDGPWRVYDFEDLSVNLRQSTLLGIGFQGAASGASWPKHLPAFNAVVEAITAEDIPAAEAALKTLSGANFPPPLKAVILLLQSVVDRYQERNDMALAALDEAERLSSNMPSIHWMRADLLNQLERHDEALKSSEKYVAALGPDMDIYVVLSDAYRGLGKQKEAEENAIKALEDDPRALEAVLALALSLPAERADEIAPHFARLPDATENFEALASTLQLTGHNDAIGGLVRAFDAQHPDQSSVTAPYATKHEDTPPPPDSPE